MSKIKQSAQKMENGMAYSVKGDQFMTNNIKSQVKVVVEGWLVGQEKDRDLHAALNELEDITGSLSWVRKVCDDIRMATAIEDLEARDRYTEVIRPKIRALLRDL